MPPHSPLSWATVIYREHSPTGALAPYVMCFWELASRGGPHRVLPDGAMDILFGIGDRAARVVGPMTRALVTVPQGPTAIVGVRFRSGAAIDLLGVPARELRDEAVPVADVWGRGGRSLDARLAETRDARSAIRAIEAELSRRVAAAKAPDPRVASAVTTLRAAGGELPIPAVSAKVGVSERQLERLFEERVGYGPKLFARVMRLERSARAIGRGLGSFWCDAMGYARRAEVPHDGALGFILLENDAGEIMLQTRSSLAADLPSVAKLSPETVLFVEVASLSEAREAAKGATVLVEERTAPYGMRESVVVDPQGTVVIFAQPA